MKLISDWNLFSCCLPRTEDIESPGCTPLKTECNIVSFRSSSSLSPLSVHSRPVAATNKEQKMSLNIMTSSQSLVCYYEMENANIRIRNIFIVFTINSQRLYLIIIFSFIWKTEESRTTLTRQV